MWLRLIGIFYIVIGLAAAYFSDGPAGRYFESQNSSISSDIFIDYTQSGNYPYNGPRDGKILWQFSLFGRGNETIVGKDGTTFVGRVLADEKGGVGHVIAINSDGTEKWRHVLTNNDLRECDVPVTGGRVDEAYEAKCDISDVGVLFIAQDQEGIIYAGSSVIGEGKYTGSRFFAVLNPETGERMAGGMNLGKADMVSRISIGRNDEIYFTYRKEGEPPTLVAKDISFDKDKTLWTKTYSFENITGPAITSDGTLIFGGDKVRAINHKNGELIWEYETETTAAPQFAPAVASDGTIYVTSFTDFNLHAINPDGTLKWKTEVGFGEMTPAIDSNGGIYIHTWEDLLGVVGRSISLEAGLHAFYPDGSLKWTKPGFFALTEKEKRDADIRGTKQKYSGSDSSIAISADGILYFGADHGRIYAVDSKDGSIIFEAVMRGEFDNRPTISADGTVTVCHAGGPGLTDGRRCVAFNDKGTIDPSPGPMILDNDFNISGATAGQLFCFDQCVDTPGNNNEEVCAVQCNISGSVSGGGIDENNSDSGDKNFDKGTKKPVGSVKKFKNEELCLDYCIDSLGKGGEVCRVECGV